MHGPTTIDITMFYRPIAPLDNRTLKAQTIGKIDSQLNKLKRLSMLYSIYTLLRNWL